jgi:hypothetical protein
MASNSQTWKSVRVNATPAPTQQPLAAVTTPTRSPFTPTAALVMNNKAAPTTPVGMATSTVSNGTPQSQSAQSIAKKDVVLPKINVIHDPRLQPTPVRVSNTIQARDFSQPGHRFDQTNLHSQSMPPMYASNSAAQLQHPPHQHPAGMPHAGAAMMKSNKIVDSRAEMKSYHGYDGRSVSGTSVDSSNSVKSIPQYIGTSFAHLPSSKRVYIPTELPQHPTLPKPYPGLVQADFNGQDGLLSNRTADGKIVGNVTKRFVSEAHVPYYDHSAHIVSNTNEDQIPVGPDNPYQAINDTWTKCWDKEAGAVYYYNNVSGEATWIMPDL